MPPTSKTSSLGGPTRPAAWDPWRSALLSLAGFAVWACGAADTVPASPDEAEEPPRRPDGIAIDPTSAPPAPTDEATVSDGLVTLRTPLGVDVAVETVERLFRGVQREDGERVAALFTQDAIAITSAAPGNRQTPNAALWWDRRFSRLDYALLQGETVYRPSDVSVARGKDVLDGSAPPVADADGLDPADVVVRVPIMTPRVGQVRLLGDEMVLFLRRSGQEYKIYRMLEEFTLQ